MPPETLDEWKALAVRNAEHARFWQARAAAYYQQARAARNTPEQHIDKRISYQDRTGDTATARADRERN